MPARALNLARQLVAERSRPESLERDQLIGLRRLVNESYRDVPAYRCLMQRARVSPGDINSLTDIERLPVLRKEDLLEFPEKDRLNSKRAERYSTTRILTSGSSGRPFEFVVDSVYNKWRKAQYLRPYVTNGRRPWHRVLRLTSDLSRSPTALSWLQPFPEHRAACSAPPEEHLSALRRLRPAIIQGYPSALRCLAFEILQRNLSTPHVRTIFTDSELLTPDSRSLIQKAFGAPVLDVFGSYETDNIAYQCASDSDYHVAVDSVIPEIVHEGSAVDSGSGDLVVTVLNNLAMPFIRYNLQDRARHVASPCRCGRSFPLLQIKEGRNDDLIVVADGGRRSAVSILWRIDALSDVLREYQITQTSVNQFVVRVVAIRPLTENEEAQIHSAILEDIPSAHISIQPVAKIERSPADKCRVFVSAIKRDGHLTSGT